MKVTRFDALGDVRIAATSHYLPSTSLSTAELFARDRSVDVDELVRLTGVLERHVASAEQATSDLAIAAARGIGDLSLVERVLVATASPDYPSPATAPLVQHGLGLPGPLSIDIAAACAGYVVALDLAARAVLTGDAAVLLVAAELRSRILEHARPSIRCMLGDGASAALVRTGHGPLRLIATALASDGSGHAAVRVEAGGSRHPTTPDTVERRLHTLRMEEGPAAFFTAVEGFVGLAEALLQTLGMRVDEIDVVVPHQPNARILERVARRLGLPFERFVVTIADTGNVGGASVGIALDRALRDGRLRPGKKVLMLTAGAGYSLAAALLEVTHGS